MSQGRRTNEVAGRDAGQSPETLSSDPTRGRRVLIVDDDSELRCFLRQELELEGLECVEASGGTQALTLLRAHRWDLVLLDWTLPDFSGVEVCRRLRRTSDTTPVLMLTAHDDVSERVEALDAGADDYLTKPFSLEELLARVRARLRQGMQQQPLAEQILRLADLELDPHSREVKRSGELVMLTAKEFDLLHLLLRRPDQAHQRGSIISAVWGDNWVGDDNILDVYIRALRRKLERSGRPLLIHTVRGVGFMLKIGDLKA